MRQSFVLVIINFWSLADKNKLLALVFGGLKELDFEVWFGKGVWPLPMLCKHIGIVVKFPRLKSDNISPYFLGGNHVAFRIKCIMAHITLFSPNFYYEIMARRCHIFTAKIWHSFALGAPWPISRISYLYMACINMLGLRHAEAHWSIDQMMHVAYTGKPMSLADIDMGNHTHDKSCT